MSKVISALIKKEFHQIFRDPSSLIIAFLLPLILLLIYMYGINLDTAKINMGLKDEDNTPQTQLLIDKFNKSKYIKAEKYVDSKKLESDLAASKINGFVIIPNGFTSGKNPEVLVVTDSSEANTANFVTAYASGIVASMSDSNTSLIVPQSRYWFNQDIDSRNFILPGSLAVTMTLIGILLTALVIAREWEKGTMESLLAMKIRKVDFLLAKYISYYLLGIASMIFSVFLCVVVFKIPFLGSFLSLFIFSSLFLFSALGTGFLISTKLKDQFLASQAALVVGMLPALMLSGLMFPIKSMPLVFRIVTNFLPARHLVVLIQNEFLCGFNLEIFTVRCAFLLALSILLFALVYVNTQEKLD